MKITKEKREALDTYLSYMKTRGGDESWSQRLTKAVEANPNFILCTQDCKSAVVHYFRMNGVCTDVLNNEYFKYGIVVDWFSIAVKISNNDLRFSIVNYRKLNQRFCIIDVDRALATRF